MSAAPKLEAGAPEGARPKRLPRPVAPPPASTFRPWGPGDRCAREGCGTPRATCFHWPGVAIDRTADAAANAGAAPKAAPAPAPAIAYEAPRLRGPSELTLTPVEAPKKKGGRRGR